MLKSVLFYGASVFLASSAILSANTAAQRPYQSPFCEIGLGGFLGFQADEDQEKKEERKQPFVSIFKKNEKISEKEPESLSEYGKQFEEGSREAKLFNEMPEGGFSKISFCVEQIALRTKALKVIAARQESRVKQLMADDKDILFFGNAADGFKSVDAAIRYYHANNSESNSTLLQLIYTDVVVAKYFADEIVIYGQFLVATVPNVLELELDEFNSGIKEFNKDLNRLIESPLDIFDGGFKDAFKDLGDTLKRIFNKKKYFKQDLENIVENTKEILENTAKIVEATTKTLDTFLKGLKTQIQTMEPELVQNEAMEFLEALTSSSDEK